jgi:cell division protein ZipA
MSELRWILLGAGLALIAGIYLWGLRARRRSAAAEPARAVIFEQPPASERLEPARIEPLVEFEDDAPPVYEQRLEQESGQEFVRDFDREADLPPARSQPGSRREPTLGQRLVASEPGIQPQSMFADERDHGLERDEPESREDDSETAVVARAQRIVAIRVTAPSPSRFEGSLLQEALAAEGFEFGRYQVFHRLDEAGRPVISLASLREPGTFDPATMAGAAYAGVALFSVLPGPVPAQQAFEELFAVGRSFAGRLGGNLQDERGAPLTVQRVAQLREEMTNFDRAQAGQSGR